MDKKSSILELKKKKREAKSFKLGQATILTHNLGRILMRYCEYLSLYLNNKKKRKINKIKAKACFFSVKSLEDVNEGFHQRSRRAVQTEYFLETNKTYTCDTSSELHSFCRIRSCVLL